MKTVLAFGLVLGLLLTGVPAVSAHGSAITHVQPFSIELPAGQQGGFNIEYEEGDLREDWVFLLNAVARGNDVQITLRDFHGISGAWDVAGDAQTQHLTARIKRTEQHGLVIFNPGPNTANLTLFYDASCNCAGKPIPPDVPKGAVIFNVDVEDGDIMRTEFPEPSALKLRVTHAVRTTDTSVWPKDFRILSVSETPNQERDGKPTHVFDWTADRTGRYYFFVEAVEYDASKFDPSLGEMAMLAVYVEPNNSKVGTAESPGPSAAVGLLAVAALAALGARGKRNR